MIRKKNVNINLEDEIIKETLVVIMEIDPFILG